MRVRVGEHKFWRAIAHDYDQLEKRAPDGYEPFVHVFLFGRPEPIEIGFVEVRKTEGG